MTDSQLKATTHIQSRDFFMVVCSFRRCLTDGDARSKGLPACIAMAAESQSKGYENSMSKLYERSKILVKFW